MKAVSKKRDAIIQATIELAAEKGINGASTALIAERAKTAEVTIFRQFKTKEALLHIIFAEQMQRIEQILLQGHDEGLSIKGRFTDFCTKIVKYFLDSPLELSFLEQYLHTPIGWNRRPDLLYKLGENFEAYPLIQLFAEGVQKQKIKDLPMPILIGMVIGALGAFARECHQKGIQHDQKIFDNTIQACWQGVKV